MNIWETTIYEGNGIWNWKAIEKDSDITIPVFGKGFDSKFNAKQDFKEYAKRENIENYEYVTVKKKEESNE